MLPSSCESVPIKRLSNVNPDCSVSSNTISMSFIYGLHSLFTSIALKLSDFILKTRKEESKTYPEMKTNKLSY